MDTLELKSFLHFLVQEYENRTLLNIDENDKEKDVKKLLLSHQGIVDLMEEYIPEMDCDFTSGYTDAEFNEHCEEIQMLLLTMVDQEKLEEIFENAIAAYTSDEETLICPVCGEEFYESDSATCIEGIDFYSTVCAEDYFDA